MSQSSFLDFVLEQLESLDGVGCRAMFGGFGLYRGERIFGIVYGDVLYFRTDSESRRAYREQGMRPFSPGGGQTLHAYWEVPAEVLEDPEKLSAWAEAASATHDRPDEQS